MLNKAKYATKNQGYSGIVFKKKMNANQLMGQKYNNKPIKLLDEPLVHHQNLGKGNKNESIVDKYRNEKNEMNLNRAENLYGQRLDLQKFPTAKIKNNNNQFKYMSFDKYNNQKNNINKSTNSHYAIESKVKKNQQLGDTSGTKKFSSKPKNEVISDFSINKCQKSENILLENKTKPLKYRINSSHPVKRTKLKVDGNIETPSKKQNHADNSQVSNSSQKNNS